jgi:methylphosphotriester-DNA--protein-cysteine methyltransferase
VSPYGYLMARRIERAIALLRRGALSVTKVCFAVGVTKPIRNREAPVTEPQLE